MGEAIRAVLLGLSCIRVTPGDGLADGVRRCIAEIDAAVGFARARRKAS